MPQAVVRSRVWTEEQLTKVQKNPFLAEVDRNSIPSSHPALLMTKGGYLAFASTQPKKPNDATEVIAAAEAHIKIINPNEVLHWFLSADEKSKTFIGNAHEKVQAILTRIYDDLGYEKVAGRYRERGINPDQVVFCMNDCGAYLNVDYSSEPEFARSLHEKGFGPWPGVEFGPVTDAQGGMLRFFLDLKNMADRKKAAGEIVDLNGWDEQTYLLFKLVPHRSQVRIFSFEAKAPIEFVTKPSPANDDVLTSFHFTRSTDDSIPAFMQHKTRADLGHSYLRFHSAEAYALNEFIKQARVPIALKIAHESVPVKRDFTAASQHNIIPPTQAVSYDYLPENIKPQSNIYDTSKPRAYQKLTRDSDALILGPHTEEITSNWDNRFIELFDMWAAVTVDKQVNVETFDNRPFVVLNRKNPFTYQGKQNGDLDWNDPAIEKAFIQFLKDIDPKEDPWLKFILFTRYLHEKGFVKQEPRFLFQQFDPNDPRYKKFLANNLGKEKAHIPFYELEEYGQDENGMFEVSVIGSASTRVASYTQDAFDFGYWGAGRGWHARNGGGRFGIMGHHYIGFDQYMKKNPEIVDYSHFSAIQMPRTLQFEGCSLLDYNELNRRVKAGEHVNRYLRVAENFDWRMRSIFRSHANVAMASGVGSYDEIARFCRLSESGDPVVRDKKMILFNQEHVAGPEHPRLMDAFLAMCSDGFKKRHFIITPTLPDTKDEVLEIEQSYLRGELELVMP